MAQVVRDPATGKYVMLFHISKPDLGDPEAWSAVGVASAPRLEGPWAYVTSFLPNGNRSWDMNVFQEDGVTYLVRAMGNGPDSHLTVSPLFPNYTAADAPVAVSSRVRFCLPVFLFHAALIVAHIFFPRTTISRRVTSKLLRDLR
jgi:hypothetical protein